MVSLALLGLTAYRVHHTKKLAGFYDPIVVELMVTAVLTMLWVPFAILGLLRRAVSSMTTGALHTEALGLFVLWVMWLVGSAIATNKWPSKAFCGFGKQCNVLIAIVALGWVAFGLLTLIVIAALMHYAAAHAGGTFGRGVGAGHNGAARGDKTLPDRV